MMFKQRARVAAVIAAMLLLLPFFAPPVGAAERRIRIPRGRNVAVVRGVVGADGRGNGDFVLRAGRGQMLTLTLVARGDTVFSLTSPSGENMAGEGASGQAGFSLTETGDYRVSVINRDNVRRRFRLTVRLR